MEDLKNMEKFKKDGFQLLKEATLHSNALPSDANYSYYMTNEVFKKSMHEEGEKILSMMNTIIKHYGVKENIRGRQLEDKDEVLIEGNDMILERASINIDEMNGIKRIPDESVIIQTVTAQLPVGGSWNKPNRAVFSLGNVQAPVTQNKAESTIKLLTGHNILRPQKFFKDKIDNSNGRPWEPRIKEKPNSIGPLAIFLEEEEDRQEYSHPYQLELEKFKPPPELLKPCKPVIPKSVAETPLHEISAAEQLDEMVKELLKYDVIAVDLEHHSYRTFMGLTCLMQISTVDADYIIDTLALRDKLYILNEVFTKPSILKVFHGADKDILWLQRDLSLYVVNMFDTYRASKLLGYSGLSLAYLMNRFCQFNPNKQFQLADWRIRPLPEELKSYAREDTHFLIYIYQMLRNELLEKGTGDNLLEQTFKDSTQVCMQRYFKPRWTEESHLEFYRRGKRMFDNRQMYALKELYKWRDAIARDEDESTGYVLPNHMLFQICENLPKEMQGILACCNPVPPLVRANLLEIHKVILRAREQSLQKAIMKEDTRSRGSAQQVTKVNIDSPLYCPHDLSRLQEFRDDLPTLLGSKNDGALEKARKVFSLEKKKPMVSIFDTPENSDDEDAANSKIKNLRFLGPYERYKLVKPFLQEQEEKAEKEKEETAKENDKTEDAPVVDRIASLHEHFVKVLNEVPPPPEKPEHKEDSNKRLAPEDSIKSPPAKKKKYYSLLEMGGRKRRKEDDSNEGGDEAEEESPTKMSKRENLQTPIPQFFNTNKNNKFRGKNNRNSKRGGRNNSSVNGEGSNSNNPGGSSLNKFGGEGGRKRNKKKWASESSKPPEPTQKFDYSKVDYSQFQGGARDVGTNNSFNTKWKGKRKNKNKGGGKQNNMSFSYSTKK